MILKPFVLVIYLMSYGMFTEPYATEADCEEALVEASLVKGRDMMAGGCFDRDDVVPGEPMYVRMP